LPPKEYKVLKDILKNEGLRFTKQRQAIWDEIKSSKEHQDVDNIYFNLQKREIAVSRATVYRTIEVLVKNKLVSKMDVGDGKSRYELELNQKHHDHMICLETGDIIEFYNQELEELQEKIVSENGYELIRHVHQLFVRPLKK
tara:strand:- start:157936 stop:158361 length:426 start_codon:yes stop_codon:yes gene_type:complete